jgi:acetate---CoA ligase (ADP-forming)
VALKAVIEGVTHKSDVGLVRLGLGSPDQLRRAYLELGSPAQVIIQPNLEAELEAIAGPSRSADLGLVLVVGLGGIYAEALGDALMWCVPASPAHIAEKLSTGPLGTFCRALAGGILQHQKRWSRL